MTINNFRGQYRFLSNFYVWAMNYEGIAYPTVEHAFQAAKAENKRVRRIFAALEDPGDAKLLGRAIRVREDWDDVKIQVMRDLLKIKFSNEALMLILTDTRGNDLIEGNYWHDNFWGDCGCPKCEGVAGQNNLGKLLMEVRG